METELPTAEPMPDRDTHSADNTQLKVIDDFEVVECSHLVDTYGNITVIDAVGRPRLVRKAR
jgi:hypothetical protein